jgi:hypothetical protein
LELIGTQAAEFANAQINTVMIPGAELLNATATAISRSAPAQSQAHLTLKAKV